MPQKSMEARDLPNKIAEIRKRRGLTRLQLSELSGINKGTLYRLEHQIWDIRLTTIIRLCGALEVSPNELLGYEDANL